MLFGEGYHAAPPIATATSLCVLRCVGLRESRVNAAVQAVFCFDCVCGNTNPLGSRVVDRSTPERSAPRKSVSRKIATPRSAPLISRRLDVGGAKIDVAKLRPLKIYVGKIAAEEFDTAGLRFAQIGAGKNRFGQVGVSQIGFSEVRAG